MQGRADIDRVRWIDRAASFLNVLYLALLVHHEGRAARELCFLVEDSVGFRDFAFHVAEKRELDSDLLRERRIGGRSIDADAEYGRVVEVYFAGVDTRLVSLKLFCSTTGEGEDIERQDHRLLASVVAQLHCCSLITAQREVWRRVSDLQKSVGKLLLRRSGRGKRSQPGQARRQHEGNDSFRHPFILSSDSRIASGREYTLGMWRQSAGSGHHPTTLNSRIPLLR